MPGIHVVPFSLLTKQALPLIHLQSQLVWPVWKMTFPNVFHPCKQIRNSSAGMPVCIASAACISVNKHLPTFWTLLTFPVVFEMFGRFIVEHVHCVCFRLLRSCDWQCVVLSSDLFCNIALHAGNTLLRNVYFSYTVSISWRAPFPHRFLAWDMPTWGGVISRPGHG